MTDMVIIYGIMAAAAVVFWMWTRSDSGKKWIKNL